jgi:hypothetical protein
MVIDNVHKRSHIHYIYTYRHALNSIIQIQYMKAMKVVIIYITS